MAENLHLRAIKSFYSLQHGGMITLEDDVLSIVSQVRDDYGDKVSIQLDPVTGWYHFVGHEDDGTDRLIFSVDELDPRALDRLRRADGQARGFEDPYLAVEREQDEHFARLEEEGLDKVRASGEELAFHLKKQGIMPRLPMSIPVTKEISADQ